MNVNEILHQRSASVAALLTCVALALGSLAVWIYSIGPHVDTSFEYLRLLDAPSLAEYLSLVARDNQPPTQMLLNWAVYAWVTQDFNTLRFAIGSLFLLICLVLAGWCMRYPTWSLGKSQSLRVFSPQWNWCLAMFALLLALSPVVSLTLGLLRYATLLSVVWLATWAMVIRTLAVQRRTYALASGALAGTAMLVSYSAIALLLFVLAAMVWRARPLVPFAALGALPGLAGTMLWAVWAGPQFIGNVASKSGSSLVDRTVAFYENALWPIVGAVSLPSPWSLVLVPLGLTSIVLIVLRTTSRGREIRTLLAANVLIAAGVFGAAGVVNANMTGPAMVVMLLLASVPLSAPTSLRIASVSVPALLLVWIATTALTLSNNGVLRPFKYSNASNQLAAVLAQSSLDNATLFVDVGEWNTEALLRSNEELTSATPASLATRNLRSFEQVIVILGDDMDRTKALACVTHALEANGFSKTGSRNFGAYSFASLRRLFGLYNTGGYQYSLITYTRLKAPTSTSRVTTCS